MSNIIEINGLPDAVESLKAERAEGVLQHDTAVILHLYYGDLWDEICGYLANLGEHFDLYNYR